MLALIAHAARRLVLLFGFGCLMFGCTRAATASMLPALQLGLYTQRVRSADALAVTSAEQRWSAALFMNLRFSPQVRAAQLPQRAELNDENWLSPCDVDDVSCLQDAITLDPELAQNLGEQQ